VGWHDHAWPAKRWTLYMLILSVLVLFVCLRLLLDKKFGTKFDVVSRMKFLKLDKNSQKLSFAT
jgi:hypothetical protein